MSQLDKIYQPTASVEYQGQTLNVQGLTLAHITFIARHHGTVLENLYQTALEGKLPTDIAQIALTMADEFAPLSGKIIACGFGEPENAERASAIIPFVLQCELIDKIVQLTLVENDGLGKVMEIVKKLTQGMTNLQNQ